MCVTYNKAATGHSGVLQRLLSQAKPRLSSTKKMGGQREILKESEKITSEKPSKRWHHLIAHDRLEDDRLEVARIKAVYRDYSRLPRNTILVDVTLHTTVSFRPHVWGVSCVTAEIRSLTSLVFKSSVIVPLFVLFH